MSEDPKASKPAASKPPAPSRARVWLRRGVRALAGLLLVLLLALVVTGVAMHEPLPPELAGDDGETGERADAMARAIQEAVRLEDWERTRAVRWTFRGAHEHLWDRDGGRVRVRWDDVEVRLRLHDRGGPVTVGGQAVAGDEAAELREDAYAMFINDSFWLQPTQSFFDEGVTRRVVTLRGEEVLAITYGSGGVTPGDTYVWFGGEEGAPPVRWKMWVSILPIGGVDVSWQGWQELATGAKVSTEHLIEGVVPLRLEDVEGAESLEALDEADAFDAP